MIILPKVLIVMGSKSDEEIAKKAAEVLQQFGVDYDVEIASAHRTPEKVIELCKKAEEGHYDVIIAIAGLSAHLPGFVAAFTRRPVIGIPRNVSLLGLDSLLSIVQMPPKVPVATVGIDNAKNAAFLALRILALKYDDIDKKLRDFMEAMRHDKV